MSGNKKMSNNKKLFVGSVLCAAGIATFWISSPVTASPSAPLYSRIVGTAIFVVVWLLNYFKYLHKIIKGH
jgi:hypothetical protein